MGRARELVDQAPGIAQRDPGGVPRWRGAMRRSLAFTVIALLAISGAAVAGPLGASPPVAASATAGSPLAACTADNVPGQSGTNSPNSEVEPWVAVNPAAPAHLVGAWQQDRWSDGGARGNVSGVSFDGGATWTNVVTTYSSLCTGGTTANGGDFQRATDPWTTFAPNGDVYLMHLSLNSTDFDHAMLVTKSTDGGLTWGAPTTLLREDDANVFNDKNSMTADPNEADGSHVYAVWDRLVFPNERAADPAAFRALAFRGPVYFTRTTDGGVTWEPARNIFDPGQNNQTLGNQIAVLPNNAQFDGELVNVFNLIVNFKRAGFLSGRFRAAVLHSSDQGASWSTRPVIVDGMRTVGVRDPDDGDRVRTGDLIPDVAVDPTSGHLYVVWQDARFSSGAHDGIALSKSTDGGHTWSTPVQVNVPKGVPAFTPSVHVSPDGTVGVSYYDFRNNTADPDTLPTDLWLRHSHDAGATWSAETRVTSSSFDMEQAPVARGFFVGDYVGLTGSGTNGFVSFFSQANSTSDPATVHSSRVIP